MISRTLGAPFGGKTRGAIKPSSQATQRRVWGGELRSIDGGRGIRGAGGDRLLGLGHGDHEEAGVGEVNGKQCSFLDVRDPSARGGRSSSRRARQGRSSLVQSARLMSTKFTSIHGSALNWRGQWLDRTGQASGYSPKGLPGQWLWHDLWDICPLRLSQSPEYGPLRRDRMSGIRACRKASIATVFNSVGKAASGIPAT